MSDEQLKGNKAVKSTGNPPAVRGKSLGNSAAFSRAVRSQWDTWEVPARPKKPYEHCEYPKHVYPDPEDPTSSIIVNCHHEELEVLKKCQL